MGWQIWLCCAPSHTFCRTNKLTHWWAISNYSIEIVPAVAKMVMQNSLLHTAKINRGCVPHGLRKATVDHIGLQHSWTTGTEQDGGSGSVTWSSRRQCFRDPDNSHLFAMWILSQTSHPRDVISHASITLSQDPNKLGIFLRKQTLSIRQQMFHICCADVQGLKP